MDMAIGPSRGLPRQGPHATSHRGAAAGRRSQHVLARLYPGTSPRAALALIRIARRSIAVMAPSGIGCFPHGSTEVGSGASEHESTAPSCGRSGPCLDRSGRPPPCKPRLTTPKESVMGIIAWNILGLVAGVIHLAAAPAAR
jgi:hypothetical protein